MVTVCRTFKFSSEKIYAPPKLLSPISISLRCGKDLMTSSVVSMELERRTRLSIVNGFGMISAGTTSITRDKARIKGELSP